MKEGSFFNGLYKLKVFMYNMVMMPTFKKFSVEHVARLLNAGGIIVFPTETVYGLGCDATNPGALLKIYKIKQREFGKSFPLLVKDFAMLSAHALATETQKKIIRAAKKPTTFVLKAKNLSPLVTTKQTAAFRITQHPWIRRLFKYFDKPIVATSANISGQKPLQDPREYKEVFGGYASLIDAVVFVGVNRKTKPSRIIDLTKQKPVVIRP